MTRGFAIPVPVEPTIDRAESTSDFKGPPADSRLKALGIGYIGDTIANPVRKGQLFASADLLGEGDAEGVFRVQGYLYRGVDPSRHCDIPMMDQHRFLLRVWNSYAVTTIKVIATFLLEVPD